MKNLLIIATLGLALVMACGQTSNAAPPDGFNCAAGIVAPLGGFIAISTGADKACAINNDGQLVCWQLSACTK